MSSNPQVCIDAFLSTLETELEATVIPDVVTAVTQLLTCLGYPVAAKYLASKQ